MDVFSVSNSAPRVESTGTSTRIATAVRRAEELRNSRISGTSVNLLGFMDASARGHSQWFGMPHFEAEKELFNSVKRELSKLIQADDRLFFPLGIGQHLDHLLVSRIGISYLLDNHKRIFFYEDLPYASRWPRQYGYINLGEPRGLSRTLLPIDFVAKLELCRTYKSQFRIYTPLRIVAYSKMLRHDGKSYERVWNVNNPKILGGLAN